MARCVLVTPINCTQVLNVQYGIKDVSYNLESILAAE